MREQYHLIRNDLWCMGCNEPVKLVGCVLCASCHTTQKALNNGGYSKFMYRRLDARERSLREGLQFNVRDRRSVQHV